VSRSCRHLLVVSTVQEATASAAPIKAVRVVEDHADGHALQQRREATLGQERREEAALRSFVRIFGGMPPPR